MYDSDGISYEAWYSRGRMIWKCGIPQGVMVCLCFFAEVARKPKGTRNKCSLVMVTRMETARRAAAEELQDDACS